MIQDAVMRELEIIGEASKAISKDVKQRTQHIPWDEIGDMRNRLIHEYFRVDVDIVWHASTVEVKHLKEQVEKLLKRM